MCPAQTQGSTLSRQTILVGRLCYSLFWADTIWMAEIHAENVFQLFGDGDVKCWWPLSVSHWLMVTRYPGQRRWVGGNLLWHHDTHDSLHRLTSFIPLLSDLINTIIDGTGSWRPSIKAGFPHVPYQIPAPVKHQQIKIFKEILKSLCEKSWHSEMKQTWLGKLICCNHGLYDIDIDCWQS